MKTSKDYSLENLSQSTIYQCPCLNGAGRGAPEYSNFQSWTDQILDITADELTHKTHRCTDKCTNEIIRDIICTDSSGHEEILLLLPIQTDLKCSEYCIKADRDECAARNANKKSDCRKQSKNLICSGKFSICSFALNRFYLSISPSDSY